MREAFICDGIRTPIGRYGGALASVRADDDWRRSAAGAAEPQPQGLTRPRSMT